ncbi:MAG: hypothetical protein M1838_000348 [Thelocarpon superellum]|nr:MAG: hypothetical protein M1838_000348 [Thelocarpon superellum]
MPLVVPGINDNHSGNDAKTEWTNKLVGKKISESTSDATNFAKRDLPSAHRVLPPGSLVTKDFQPDR